MPLASLDWGVLLLMFSYSRVDSTKRFTIVRLFFPQSSKEKRLFLGPILSVLVGDFRLEAFAEPNPGYMRANKKTQGTICAMP